MSLLAPLPFTAVDLDSSLPLRFDRVLQQLPAGHLAYVGVDATLTYRELAAASHGVAAALVTQLGHAGRRAEQQAVALFLPHTAASLIGMLGVLQTGHFFVPLDLIMGEITLQKILVDCPPRVILTTAAMQPQLAQLLPGEQAPLVLCIENIPPVDGAPTFPLPTDPQLYASIQYTSGSTGMQRGVIRTHATHLNSSHLNHTICNFLPSDRVSHLLSYSLSMSNADIFGGVLNGATLVAHEIAKLTPSTLYQWLATNAVTRMQTSVGMLRGLATLAETHPPLTSLRVIASGGEVMRRPEVEELCRLLPTGGKLVLRLASTEAGAYANCVVEAGQPWQGDHTAVGTLPLNHQVMLVDENRQPVAAGEVGEIVVRSRFLAAGYWQRPAETAAKFQSDPDDCRGQIFFTGDTGRMTADGRLEFLGRTDFLVKIRGYRIQLEEVEAALTALPMVQAAVALAQTVHSGEKELVAYVVPRSQPAPTISALRQALAERLPTYMVPTRFKRLDALPMTSSGKVDRRALLPVGNERPELDTPFAAPRTVTEIQLAAIWEEILEVHPIGVQDHFFELGGHSIAMMRLLHQIEQQFHQGITLRHFVFNPTIAHMATLLNDPLAKLDTSERNTAADERLHAIYDALDDLAKIQKLRRELDQSPVHSRRLPMLLRLSQPITLSLLYRLLQYPWVQQRYLPEETALVQQFLAALEQPTTAENVARCLFFGCLIHFNVRSAILPRIPKGTIPIKGLELLERASEQQQGAILLINHAYPMFYFHALKLRRMAIMSMGPFVRALDTDRFRAEHILYSRQLEVARQTLQAGGNITIAPDMSQGRGTQITVPFHGHLHEFRTSFADLALLTDAPIFFIACDLQAYNRFSFQVVGPFDTGTLTMSYTERVQHLMNQYIAHLRRQWASNPWAIPWWLMRQHLAYPPVTI